MLGKHILLALLQKATLFLKSNADGGYDAYDGSYQLLVNSC
jgi:hypothetical protein